MKKEEESNQFDTGQTDGRKQAVMMLSPLSPLVA